MKIAILGWGSLIWNPENLEIDKTKGENGWCDDGPELPIEFARISNNGRLTLVIVDKTEAESIQTLYAISMYTELDHAVLNLAVREGCGKDKIGSYDRSDNKFVPDKFKCKEEIKNWMFENEDINAVIWTNLTRKFKNKIGLDWNEENVVNYLNYLPLEIKALAEEYIRKTPAPINTKMRQVIEKELDWYKIT